MLLSFWRTAGAVGQGLYKAGCDLCAIGARGVSDSFRSRQMIKLSVSRLTLLAGHDSSYNTAGATPNRGRTSKPCDTSRRVHSQANAYSTGRCLGALRAAHVHTHTHETWRKAIRHVSPSSTHGTLPPGRSQGLILQYRCAWESYAVGGPLTPLEYTFGSRHALHSASVRACTAFPKRLRSLNISAICVSPTARSQSHVMFGS